MLSTKDEVYGYLEKISRDFEKRNLKYFTANDISEKLNISRNLASQYLNELVKEEKVIKVNSRPVYFFHRKSIELIRQVKLDACVFPGLDEFHLKCRTHESKRDFQKAIGHYLSLSPCVEQLKAAMQYPPNGLPVILYGANGIGKSYMARLMFEYGINERVLPKGSRYVVVDCTEYAQNADGFAYKLCGGKDGKGWLREADKGVLFLDEIDHLPLKGQELIYSYLISGRFKGIGAEEAVFESSARLVFASSREPQESMFKALARRIPISISIPALNERTSDEKEEMLVYFLKKEGQRMGVNISISQNAFHCILDYPFENNIEELKFCITGSCASAYLEREENQIVIRTYHLPEYMITSIRLETDRREDRVISISDYSKEASFEGAVHYFQEILELYHDFQEDRINLEQLLEGCIKKANDYYDYLIYDRKLVNSKISSTEQLLNRIIENVGEVYQISLSRKYSYLMARSLYIQLSTNHIVNKWQQDNEAEIKGLLQTAKAGLEKEAVVMGRVVQLIKQNLDMETSSMNQFLLLLNIWSQNQTIKMVKTGGIILSHGYSTASSIADAANRIIGSKVFEAIDMPLDIRTEEIAAMLEKHISRYITCRDIILMVDMGSLESIHEEMKGLRNLNIGIINNISTALAIDIGNGILQDMSMEEILRRASESNVCRYRIFNNVQKEDAIIFSGENGIDIAEKIKELLLKITDTSVKVRFIAYDYHRLVKNGMQDEIFDQYRVMCMIGLADPKVDGVRFIPLEDIITMNATEKLNQVFSAWLDEKQLESFNQNLVKTFSLQNVVESITILNPDKLLDEVEQSVKRLQRSTGQMIEGRLMIGLYVHLCCLVERLVTKNAMESYGNIAQFKAEHADFIDHVKECFQGITNHYKVELPVSEIAYIYDYINLNKNNSADIRNKGNKAAALEDE